ncbi:MAG: carbohydrate ABC transporter permease [Candidatus Nanoarchaeia archaeon]|nr:carbohydrate ABC transporter permease [Candidatus Jingweiarchaeum tengchongense]
MRKIGLFVIVIIASVYFIFPFYWMIESMTKSTSQLFLGTLSFGSLHQFIENIIKTFSYSDGIYGTWFLNSLFYSFTGGFIGTFMASLGGFAFSRYRFLGKRVLFILILGFSMVPGVAGIIPLFEMFKNVSLLNTYWAIILPSFSSVFGIYLMTLYWNQVPQDIFDAAKIDGANDIRIFFQIGFPLVSSAFITLFLLGFIGIWNNYFLALIMLSSSDKSPLILGLSNINSLIGLPGQSGLYPVLITGSFFSILPLILIFFAFQKFLTPKIIGAIK